MPALNAARTALTCPRVNETVATSACRFEDLLGRVDRFWQIHLIDLIEHPEAFLAASPPQEMQ